MTQNPPAHTWGFAYLSVYIWAFQRGALRFSMLMSCKIVDDQNSQDYSFCNFA